MNIQYKYTDFKIENHNITFADSGEDGVLISVPFADDTPQCIKDKLNEIINKGMDEWSRLGTWNGILTAIVPEAKDLLLDARIQISYDYKQGTRYYIAATITELTPYIDKDILVSSHSELHNEVVMYCRYKLDKILFPVW